MKRERNQEIDHHQSVAMANYLMLLSKVTTNYTSPPSSYSSSPTLGRVFECKTCNRQFSSFQALGGHRASHKKPRTTMIINMRKETKNNNDDNNNNDVLIVYDSSSSLPSNKPKTHECSICGLEFAIGQALGGHMRRHRVSQKSSCRKNNDNNSSDNLKIHSPMSMSNDNVESLNSEEEEEKKKKKKDYLLMDLNLTPWENDLETLRIKKATSMTPLVDCFY